MHRLLANLSGRCNRIPRHPGPLQYDRRKGLDVDNALVPEAIDYAAGHPEGRQYGFTAFTGDAQKIARQVYCHFIAI